MTFPRTGTPGRIDLYKRGHSSSKPSAAPAPPPAQLPLLPARPAAGARPRPAWDDAMIRARGQAEAYARALPDEYPPFLVTVAVGQEIQLFADFSRTGKNYTHFPDATRFRIRLDDLRDPAIRDRLALVWSDPDALDPARTAARVTREIAGRLAARNSCFVGAHPPRPSSPIAAAAGIRNAEGDRSLAVHRETLNLGGLAVDRSRRFASDVPRRR